MGMRSRFHSWLFSSVVCSALALGCSNQGEGERCDTANNNLDCQSGLLCRPITGATYSLCCPAADQPSSAPACSNVAIPTGADAAAEASQVSPPPDASSVETAVSEEVDAAQADDAETDAETEGGLESGPTP